MTNYSTDDAERWAEVFLHPAKGRVIFTPPSEAEDVAAQAGADGIEVAMQTAESYDGRFWPSGERHWQLNTLPVVRQQLDIVMSAHRHSLGATAVSEWMPPMPGVALPSWNDGDPACMRTHFLVFACSPTTAHSMRFDSVEALLERRGVHRRSCDWRGINLMCVSSSDLAPPSS